MPTTDAEWRFKRYDMNKQEIKKEFEKYSIVLTEEKQEMFLIFLNTLKEYNEKFNITSIKEDNQIIEKHFIDSLMGEKMFFKRGICRGDRFGRRFPFYTFKNNERRFKFYSC